MRKMNKRIEEKEDKKNCIRKNKERRRMNSRNRDLEVGDKEV